MTIQDMIAEVPRLTVEEQLTLLNAITQSLRLSVGQKPHGRAALGDRLHGAWKTDGPPLTDVDVDQLRYAALMEKYS